MEKPFLKSEPEPVERVSPSYAPLHKTKYHIHRTGAWQDPTGRSRWALCGTQIGPVGRQVATEAVPDGRFCKTCVRLYSEGAR